MNAIVEIGTLSSSRWRTVFVLFPAAVAIAYPYVLHAFHETVTAGGGALSAIRVVGAALLLILAFLMPLTGLVVAYGLTREPLSPSNLRARRLAFASVGAPSLFVLVGVSRAVLHLRVPELAIWAGFWCLAAVLTWPNRDTRVLQALTPPSSLWRVAHGAAAALIACFVLFHLGNHLVGLVGPEAHAAVMKAGRTVYRSAILEPILVILLLFQVASGWRLAWRWSGATTDAFRVFQIGSGAYLAIYIVAHMNSAFISARAVHKIDTDWGWAAGAPIGLIHDAWNIRLLPHYALGVFFVIGHLFSGLRVVMIAHGARDAVANRLWGGGLAIGALVSTMIVCALCGLRL